MPTFSKNTFASHERQVRRVAVQLGSVTSKQLQELTNLSQSEVSAVTRSLIKRKELYVSGRAQDPTGASAPTSTHPPTRTSASWRSSGTTPLATT